MSPFNSDTALQQPWTAIYAKFIAIILVYGATVHVGNILGWSGVLWSETPLLWRVMDVLLLIFNGVASVGLWQGTTWSIGILFGGIMLLQFLPYTLFRSLFIVNPEDAQTLNGLLGTEAILLGLFIVLIGLKK